MNPSLEANPVLAPARIRYRDDQPYSLDFQDIYHAGDGAAEVDRVFLAPCRLDELARQRARTSPSSTVRIGELGFGSGLNFVLAAERCLAAGSRLHFVSCEAHPVDAGDFAAIAAHRARSHGLYAELARVYPPRIRGWHQRRLAGGRICLNLWLGDAGEALADMSGRQRQPLDAWFLDGFAPDRNPSLWEPALFRRIAELSGPGTRVATFTAAGRVRRGLEAAGFSMSRVDQRPHKRETLAGTFASVGLAAFEPPARITVVGGGLAGASAARHLAEAGCTVRLMEGPDQAFPPASRMPATVLHARLLGDGGATAELRCHAYLHAAARVAGLPGFTAAGALQLADGPAAESKLQALAGRYRPSGPWLRWLDRDEAAKLAAWPVPAGGLWLTQAGTVDIPVLVRSLLDHPAVEVIPETVTTLPENGPVVLACGPRTRSFPGAGYLELAPVHGQIDLVDLSSPPRLPLVGSRYLVPSPAGLGAGSTYEHRPWDPAAASARNLAQLAGHDYTWLYRCRGTRSVSSDRTAIAGPLYDRDGNACEGLYVSSGHGSAGNVSAHLAGAVLAAHLTGDCPPLARCLEAALSPLRFRERQARRGYRHGAGE